MFGKSKKKVKFIEDRGVGYTLGYLLEKMDNISEMQLLIDNHNSSEKYLSLTVKNGKDEAVVFRDKNFNFNTPQSAAKSKILFLFIEQYFANRTYLRAEMEGNPEWKYTNKNIDTLLLAHNATKHWFAKKINLEIEIEPIKDIEFEGIRMVS